MKNFTQPILTAALLLSSISLFSQDPRFSQYYASQWNLNPALTGVFQGSMRATLNYRDQWSSILSPNPFRTYSVSGEYRRELINEDYIAFGVGALRDEVGTAQFSQTKGHLGFAYLKQLAGGRYRNDQFLSVGAQLGFGQNAMDWSRLWFSRQFDYNTETPDYGAGNGENLAGQNTPLYADFNAGLLYYSLFENGGFFWGGLAGHHLNSPKIGFLPGSGETLYRRWSGHLGAQLPTSDYLSVLPGIQVMKQGPAFETDLGVNFRYSNNDLNELALRAGVWGRVGNRLEKGIGMDALTFVTMLELDRWILGLSYDVTVSQLTQANNSRGAFEISLTYIHPEQRRARLVCPKL